MNARNYRQHLYQNRSHPAYPGVIEGQSNRGPLYLSVVAFIAAEYFFELKASRIPSGLMFPVGFLFFWAFYYTYYQPGHLEKTLSSEKKWDLSGIPVILINTCIWFVKIVFVELTEKIISNFIKSQKVAPPRNASRPKAASTFHRTSQNNFKSQARVHSYSSHEAPVRGDGTLPKEITNALGIMGIPEARDWAMIQKRYRELAKKYHPDLNPELTQAGNRFMLYDAAYRKLEAAKFRYFMPKK
jgi:hypothetical protein